MRFEAREKIQVPTLFERDAVEIIYEDALGGIATLPTLIIRAASLDTMEAIAEALENTLLTIRREVDDLRGVVH